MYSLVNLRFVIDFTCSLVNLMHMILINLIMIPLSF